MNDILHDIKRLNFEDFIWILFAILSILNIIGNQNEKDYLKTNNKIFKNKANKIFEFTIISTFFIYIYFFIRNFKSYKESSPNEKRLFSTKLLGTSFLIAGIICLLYFQENENSFFGSPAI